MKSTESPRIYVACLAAYNNGILHGEWINAAQDAEDIQAEIQAMLEKSPIPGAEEWAIHDTDGFNGIHIDENPDLETVSALTLAIEEHGEAYIVYADLVGAQYATPEGFEDAYQGQWDSEQAFAENLLEDSGDLNEIPERLRYYFDYEAYTRDLFINDYSSGTDSEGNTHVFLNM